MDEYRILIKRSAEKEIAGLPEHLIHLLHELLDELKLQPRPQKVKKLVGTKTCIEYA